MIKKNHPQAYLECKSRVQKIWISKFIKTVLKSHSGSDSALDPEKTGVKFDAELMAKLKSGSDSEQDILLFINLAHTSF